MTPAGWRRVAWPAAAVLTLHVLGAAALAAGAVGAGLGLTAYTLGLRHAFDADHIAAIDATTRRFRAEGRSTHSVGFWFALGHSTVVFGAALLFILGVRAAGHGLTVIGPSVSGTFLLVIGALNVAVLGGIVRALRTGADSAGPGGLLSRIYAGATRSVRRPWHMLPLGFLFGLGFDTAAEILLLSLAAGAVPGLAVLALPVLFAAGMTLLDTLDGSFMNAAYGWAQHHPARRAYFNLVVTALSAAVALGVGAIELLGLVWDSAAAVDLNVIGFGVVGLFVLTWTAAAAAWRLGRLEERWSQ